VSEAADTSGVARRRLLMLAPLGVATAGGLAFLTMLNRMKVGKFDPHALDNPLVGKAMRPFDLPGIAGGQGFSNTDLMAAAASGPVMVNFFWSECIPCAEEADVLATLAQQGLPIWGIAWKDTAAGCSAFLKKYGNPYTRIGDDANGRVAIDWGIYGAPESFLVGKAGVIGWHIAGPLSPDNVVNDLEPALKAMT
jgi:cytochrome c biogenesis protein CcmG/thiol:disulfide interchange protein DsbE